MSTAQWAFLALALAWAALVVAGVCACWLNNRKRPPPGPAPSPLPAATPELSANPMRWVALPGNVIELGASGFHIRLNTGPDGFLYTLYAPEGRPLMQSHDLAHTKSVGQRLAAERDEFVCTERPVAMPRLHQ
jgi:hypothetical protein